MGLVTVYHVLNQTIDVQWAGSRDGKKWWRPDRRACLPLRPLGDVGGGMVWPMHPLIEEDGRIYLYYAGCDGLHNDYQSTEPVEKMKGAGLRGWPHFYEPLTLGDDTYSPVRGCVWFHSALCRASWEVGRLWAAVTASGGNSDGELFTKEFDPVGGELTVNVVTLGDGALEAELISEGRVISGFGRADCIPVQGNHRRAIVRWKGADCCPNTRLQIRFFLRRARFYGYEL